MVVPIDINQSSCYFQFFSNVEMCTVDVSISFFIPCLVSYINLVAFMCTSLVLPFWCQLTQVVPDKIQEGRQMVVYVCACVCVCVCVCLVCMYSMHILILLET